MHITTGLDSFALHFGTNLRDNSQVGVDGEEITIEIALKIGEGIQMKCLVTLDNCIKSSESPHDYKMVLRNFLKQLYEAKEHQIEF